LYLKFFIFFFSAFLACDNHNPYGWIQSLPSPWNLSENKLGSYLSRFHEMHPDFHDRLIALNLWRIGTPYGIFCLGEEKGVDPDPIIRIDSSDCTVHVLTTIALAESHSWEEARSSMINIHYKPDAIGEKKPTYNSRWHYTSDRIFNNPRTVDITLNIATTDNIEIIDIELNKKEDGAEFLDLGWTMKKQISYIPTNQISKDLLSKLPTICGVAFVNKKYFKNGIVIAHEGYVINKKDFIHASSEEKKTVKVDLMSYMDNNGDPRFDGVMFYEIRE